MFAKLSALALCLSVVSALKIVAPATAKIGGSAALHLDISAGDPTNIGLELIGPNGCMDLGTDEPINATMYVAIPDRIPASPNYVIAAVDPGQRTFIYAQSDIAIVDPWA